MRRPLMLAAALAIAAGCSPARREEPPPAAPRPNIDPATTPRAPVRVPEPEPPLERVAPPEVAAARGWLPVASTGAERFRRAHPTWDGRGVVIAILDTGIDPSIPGFAVTSTGEPKLVDVRDFSGEGAVALRPVEPAGDTVQVGPHRLAGFGRVRALAGDGPWYAGTLEERRLGPSAATDLDGDGTSDDTLALVVARASDGWVVIADRDGDGSLAGERPVRDYLRAREWFGWAPAGRTPRVGLAANLDEVDGAPRLTLVTDLDAHGSHVAGIATGHQIYGAAGLSGAGPGAQLLGLKISRSAQGMVSTTGAMLGALDYAIRFAAERRRPLVVNVSFGVGNEIEGGAVIDRLVDSVLQRHPEVVVVASAGNDGPGLSTVGFPGSASRAITAGATIPPTFLPPADGKAPAEAMAPFSARGAELAKPDVVAPGVAYSSVPRWNAGDEVKQGTSMAAPQITGVAALLLSGLAQQGRRVDAATLRRALMVTASPVGDLSLVESGRGLPDPEAALQWILAGNAAPAAEILVRAVTTGGGAAAVVTLGSASRDGTVEFALRQHGGAAAEYTLRSDVPWLRPPARVVVKDQARVRIAYRVDELAPPGAYSGVVSGWPRDTMAGPAFRLPVTVIRPAPSTDTAHTLRRDARIPAGGVLRSFFVADSARPFEVQVSGSVPGAGLAFLHEPGGRPYRGGSTAPIADGPAATFAVESEDVVPGAYELVVGPLPGRDLSATVAVRHSPVTLRLTRRGEQAAEAEITNRTAAPVRARVDLAVLGREVLRPVMVEGQDPRRLPVVIPAGTKELRIRVAMNRRQWGRFTDFGVTLVDSAGRTLGTQPLNYASGELVVPVSESETGTAELVLFPGFADPADRQGWEAQVTIRALSAAENALAPEAGDSAGVLVAPGATVSRRFVLADTASAGAESGHPLARLTVEENGHRWSRTAGLPLVTRSTMR